VIAYLVYGFNFVAYGAPMKESSPVLDFFIGTYSGHLGATSNQTTRLQVLLRSSSAITIASALTLRYGTRLYFCE
jgi:hypothetical protein